MSNLLQIKRNKIALEGINSSNVLVSGRETFVNSSLENGTITRDVFMKMSELVLPKPVLENPLKLLVLNYNCDSKVGSWTNLAMNICTALPKEFINESGIGANKKFKKAFLSANDNGKKEHYERIFKDDINVHTFTLFVDGRYIVEAYYVSNKEVNEFANRIASLDLTTLTVEDIKNIQADLWFLFRAWQESSIDMTKDKAKQFEKAMDEILGAIKVRTGVKFQDIKTNEYSIKAAKYSKEEIPEAEINFSEYDDEDDNEFLETSLSEMQHEVRVTALDKLQEVTNAFVDSSISVYEPYVRYAMDYPELAMTIMDLYRIIKDYNNTSKEDKDNGKKLRSRDYALLRAIAYKDAAELDIDFEYVAAVGLGVAGSGGVYINDNNEIVIKEFSPERMSKQLYCAEKLFGNIMVLEKGILYGSNMIYDEQYIKAEIEPRHIFTDVNDGIYEMISGDAYDNSELVFDTNSDYTGLVLVEGDKVFFLYDPITEVDNAPSIQGVFTDILIEEEGTKKCCLGVELDKILTGNKDKKIDPAKEYTLTGDVILINGVEYASVDGGYSLDEGESRTREISNWYGIGGSNWSEERELKRNNKFLLLTYNKDEVNKYLDSIVEYC